MRPSCLICREGTRPGAQVEGRTLDSSKDGHSFALGKGGGRAGEPAGEVPGKARSFSSGGLDTVC